MVDLLTRYAIYARDGYRCLYCDADVADDPTLDHVVPRASEGVSRPSNLVTSCRPCNAAKGDRPLSTFLRDALPTAGVRENVRLRISNATRKGLTAFRKLPETKARVEQAKREEAERIEAQEDR